MYDMYHWDSSVPATEDTGNTNSSPARASRPAAAAQAVQVALDRRDNGGEAGAPRDQFGRGGGGAEASRARGGGAEASRARGGGVRNQ